LGAEVAGYSFIISLDFLNGKERLNKFSSTIFALVSF
jgi:adenine phosphoribosyltransferase